ncbi:ABC-type sugar transport system ATPase subunit [Clostridium beijerinckii]|nr:ABC-type sugar transport system ATPase subunit [Clostridium beijerinckii]
MSKLLLKNVCKKYDDESYAVKNVNLEVDDKDFFDFSWAIRLW